MQEGGSILSNVMDIVLSKAQPGISLVELDNLALKEIKKRGGSPSFLTVQGYCHAICACINDVVVHGIPDKYIIQDNDVVGIDCGVYFKGFHTDSAWTIRAGNKKDDAAKNIDLFLEAGIKALDRAIAQVKVGNCIADISEAIQKTIEGAGYSVVKNLIGHGVGKKLHEDPEVPGFVQGKRTDTPRIENGLTIAIEVIYNEGNDEVAYKRSDGWTISSKDGTISGLFEATVAINHHGCFLLTKKFGAPIS